MIKSAKKLFVSGVITFSLIITGCSSNSAGGSGEKENTEAFNPDNANGQTYDEVRANLGEVPKITAEIKLGAVAKAFENEYWRTLKEGMEKGAQNFNDKGINLTVDVKSPQGEADEEGQLSIVKDMINKKYTAMLLSPISDSNLVPGVESALDAKIPVINVNDGIIKEAPNFVGPKADQNGATAAEWISDKVGGKGKVAIIVGMPKAFAARQRTIGFENWIKDNSPDIEITEKQNADWDRSKAKDIAATWIKKHDDLNAIFANNDTMALGAQEAVNESGKDILVVGVDGIGEAYESIRKGEMDATIDSFPLYKGQIAVEMILRQLGGQELPRVIWTPQAIIDSTNVDTPAEEIINWSEPTVGK
ncbi:sugar ABC transporter substrate-binding protein [Lederbergia citrea]|uniref:sugar ABC transporter substrate-binding protein n=1 Tax=Lederbergia citrea TaxID=2833581 RepID=UPI00201675E9|nr:substrate-binding domain-containing protein [Lederbergia citrea]